MFSRLNEHSGRLHTSWITTVSLVSAAQADTAGVEVVPQAPVGKESSLHGLQIECHLHRFLQGSYSHANMQVKMVNGLTTSVNKLLLELLNGRRKKLLCFVVNTIALKSSASVQVTMGQMVDGRPSGDAYVSFSTYEQARWV